MSRRNASRTNPIESNLFLESLEIWTEPRPPPLTLLSLPDDLLLPIFEDVYEQHYGAEEIPASIRIADILVNKRIFALARPLWFSRLSVLEQHLDRRLAELLGPCPFSSLIRRLDISIVESHAFLAWTVISRLSQLTHLSLRIFHPNTEIFQRCLLEALSTKNRLEVLEYCTSENLTELFRLLACTQIHRLGLAAVNWLPTVQQHTPIPSVKLLKPTFDAFALLLANLPSLIELHLVGSGLFEEGTDADAISRIDSTEIWHACPRLAALVGHLRTLKIKIFTYRGEDEEREMRWTRLTAEDDFDADCWTL
ncbi:hypothetical protein JCM11491_007131 [Sporobolomyces phaffii]